MQKTRPRQASSDATSGPANAHKLSPFLKDAFTSPCAGADHPTVAGYSPLLQMFWDPEFQFRA